MRVCEVHRRSGTDADYYAYCLKCKKKVLIYAPYGDHIHGRKCGAEDDCNGGLSMVKGDCDECGSKVSRFITTKYLMNINLFVL